MLEARQRADESNRMQAHQVRSEPDLTWVESNPNQFGRSDNYPIDRMSSGNPSWARVGFRWFGSSSGDVENDVTKDNT